MTLTSRRPPLFRTEIRRMNERQARNLHAAATGWQELLAIQFPCEACEGSGSSEQGVCAIPCVECWGRGYRLPEEGQ